MKQMSQSDFERFDFNRKPVRQRLYLTPVTWLLSYPVLWKHRTKIERVNMEGLKPPYLLLCNHNAFMDFMVTTGAIFPHRANYVVAIDGFIGREWLLRNVGCIGKRKFTNDLAVVRNLKQVIKNGDIAVLYPEARYSLCGKYSELPDSVAKLAKLLGVPVVTLITHGHHINSPFWNLEKRNNRTEATLKQIVTAEEISVLSVEELHARFAAEFSYDDFEWQKRKNIKVTYKDRAKGLHNVLYQCPACRAEYHMASEGDRIWCRDCGKVWTMSELGELSAVEGPTEFTHIPDWYEWQREQVRNEVREGRYHFSGRAVVRSLPNAKGYIDLGEGELTHDMSGFTLKGVYNGEPYTVHRAASTMIGCHIEYNYMGKYGDCVDINTATDTYYIYPKDCEFSVTKMALATEELYKYHNCL